MSDDKPPVDTTRQGSNRKLVEGETVGVVTWLGSNKRGPGGPLPPTGSQVFLGTKRLARDHIDAAGAKGHVEELIEFCRRNGRVCPEPIEWNDLSNLIPDAPAPLILAAWHHTTDADKRRRLAEHIRWADDHGKLAAVEALLRGLQEDRWHHERPRRQAPIDE